MVRAIRMAIEVPDSLRQVLNSRHADQQFVPVFLVSLVSASVASMDVQVYLDFFIFLLYFFLHFALMARGFSKDGTKAKTN